MEQVMRTYEMTDDPKEFERFQAFSNNDGLLEKYRDNTEQAMRELGEPDFEIYRPKIVDAYFPYTTRTDDQKANADIALFSVAQNEHNLTHVPKHLRTPAFINTAFKLNPRIIKFLPPAEKQRPEFIRVICKFKPELFADLEIGSNVAVTLLAVELNPSIYKQLDKEMQRVPEIINAAVKKPSTSSIKQEFYDENKIYVKENLGLGETEIVKKEKAKAKGLAFVMERPKGNK